MYRAKVCYNIPLLIESLALTISTDLIEWVLGFVKSNWLCGGEYKFIFLRIHSVSSPRGLQRQYLNISSVNMNMSLRTWCCHGVFKGSMSKII